jgi:signal transduction histidine kinase
MFLAILGHDLRSPLGAVALSSQFMLDTGDLKEPLLTLTTGIVRSAKRMNRMVGDLLEFTRSRLGSSVPIVREEMNLANEAANAVAELSSAHPNRVIQLDTSGDLRGNWDCARIGQLLANLLGNAIQHGSADTTIVMTIQGARDEIVLRVHNYGPAIPAASIPGLFRPFKRLQSGETPSSSSTSFGLGLYIAERVVAAHGGRIDVTSADDAGTAFTVHLPR